MTEEREESMAEETPASETPAEEETPESDAAPTEAATPPEATGDDELAEPPPPEEVLATAVEFMEGLLEAMGLEGDIDSSVDDGTAFLDVRGEELGLLIGRRGQTLEALQELCRTAVQRRLRSRVRLLIDVEGYRARRRESLAEYARAMAERAKRRGTEIELEPMNAYERKIVHDAVGEIDGASSFSEGEEPNRKVVVRGE
jgi:spoIIIJ-associated protein